ncbi:MAG TPA: bifunctional phosphoribosyl-AMP cyclohydrolase/phosphoribosyl-ATP diphosphatase HisIE [Candidatus Stercoripulliclostridium merdigallinarum]|uniref:Histidine biosynthesis bifunctional protein HisIE n=1 Tax=Candidatus Stercoripulliclostridium merdigallinarum TaxID=2840951 RepID=A0A9D1MHG6_9FIRM|nr:bifunctional phosphoribosyl-AMP cyclohydrolase/phosphoribosyl-ATP diphosphatase HisIE [Candidatus Stercoripulliclostridium merdigallinarum]
MESIDISNVKFDEKGLVPCVVQDYYTKQVLMLAYMNRESLIKTMETGLATFYSRSRQELWTKGATSGNLQHVVELRLDCDGDAIVAEVKKDGPACHTGNESCFYRDLFVGNDMKPFSIEGLYELIKGRKTNPKDGSYTTYLFNRGIDKILKKVGEECTEVIIEGKAGNRQAAIYELADLYYHALVMMVEMDILPKDVFEELANRHVLDKKIKQGG